MNRRSFIASATLAIPLAGCTSNQKKEPDSNSAAVEHNAAEFEKVLDVVRKFDVPYAVEPRFYPSLL